MLFMVISTPRPDQPSKLRRSQRGWWDWIRPLQDSGVVQAVYVKVGRGALVVFQVESNEQLHDLVNQWSQHIPAEFQVLPLARAEHQEKIARAGARKAARRVQ
jgi:muconolactone delta-isomerase